MEENPATDHKPRTHVVVSSKVSLGTSALTALIRTTPGVSDLLNVDPNFSLIILPGKKLRGDIFAKHGFSPTSTFEELEPDCLFLAEPEGATIELNRRMNAYNVLLKDDRSALIHPLELVLREANIREREPELMAIFGPIISNMRNGEALISTSEYRRIVEQSYRTDLLKDRPKTVCHLGELARSLNLAFPETPEAGLSALEEILTAITTGIRKIDPDKRPRSIKDTFLVIPELIPLLSKRTLDLCAEAFRVREREWVKIENQTYTYYETSAPVKLPRTGKKDRSYEGHLILGVINSPNPILPQHARDQIRKNIREYEHEPTKGSYEAFADAPLLIIQNLGDGYYLLFSDTHPERKISLAVFAKDQRTLEIQERPDLEDLRGKLSELGNALKDVGTPTYGPGKRTRIMLAHNRLTAGNSYAVDGDPVPMSFESIVKLVWETIENHYYVPAPSTNTAPQATSDEVVGTSDVATSPGIVIH